MQEAKCAYVIALMAVYWCTEVLPLAVTALLPAILFPLFGIMQSKDVSENNCNSVEVAPQGWICVHAHLLMCDAGVYGVPEGHKPAVFGGIVGRSSRGALESAQAHRLEGAARRWCASSAVSGSDAWLLIFQNNSRSISNQL